METWKDNQLVLHSWAIFLVIEMILLLFSSPPSSSLPIPWLEKLFWFILIPAIIMIIIPIIKFPKKGGVKKGDMYEKTTKLVDCGIFSIIRHPQYTGGMWIAFAMTLPNQSWMIIIIAALAIFAFALTIYLEEEKLIEKFGKEYKEYKKRTSACSLILGLIKSITWKRKAANFG